MTVQCVTCKHLNLREAGRMAREGFGRCAHRAPSQFTSARIERQCDEHTEADPSVVAERRQWLEARL